MPIQHTKHKSCSLGNHLTCHLLWPVSTLISKFYAISFYTKACLHVGWMALCCQPMKGKYFSKTWCTFEYSWWLHNNCSHIQVKVNLLVQRNDICSKHWHSSLFSQTRLSALHIAHEYIPLHHTTCTLTQHTEIKVHPYVVLQWMVSIIKPYSFYFHMSSLIWN